MRCVCSNVVNLSAFSRCNLNSFLGVWEYSRLGLGSNLWRQTCAGPGCRQVSFYSPFYSKLIVLPHLLWETWFPFEARCGSYCPLARYLRKRNLREEGYILNVGFGGYHHGGGTGLLAAVGSSHGNKSLFTSGQINRQRKMNAGTQQSFTPFYSGM